MLSAFAACLAALATAACDPMTDQYFREGAGSDLYSAQLAEATQLQDEYVYYICRQAGNHNLDPSVGGSCDGTNWTAFTLAGMNDIDRRCDAYLTWLDAQRRDRTPVLAQIAAMGGSAGAIMGVAGAGTQALSIVATAFGLAGTTYANWNSRLLLDVDHSTVQTVVYTRQQQFRKDNASTIGVIPDRASAIYVLRGYLRICMPITIETDINTSVIMVRHDAPQSLLQAPLVRAVPTVPLTPRETVAQNPRPVGTQFDFSPILASYDPSVDTVENMRAPLRALCATEAQIKDIKGNIPSLQGLIRFYQFVDTYKPRDTSLSPDVTGKLTRTQIKRLRGSSPCDLTANAKNIYEVRTRGIRGYIDALNSAPPPSAPPLANTASEAEIRTRIAQVRNAIPQVKLPFQDPMVQDQITPDLDANLP
jgi:hypothetical protein